MPIKKILFSVLAFLLLSLFGWTQPKNNVDRIVAIVAEEIILRSEVEDQLNQMIASGAEVDKNTRCSLFEDLIFQRLLLDQAKLDSIEVSDAEVQSEIDRRLRYFIQQFGSKEKLEEFYGKSLVEIKKEFADIIKDQLLVERMQGKIAPDIKITPGEVRAFYNSIPKDSLPYINSEVEIAQIVKKPPISSTERERIIAKLNEFKERVKKGENFGTLAYLYSEDPGSARNNGELGFTKRDVFVKEFADAAFELAPGEMSDIVETQFGFHLIQGILRRGDEVNCRHILITPKVQPNDLAKAKTELDSIKNLIATVDTLDFDEAAKRFSDDEATKTNGGLLINPTTGTSKFEVDQISKVDPNLFFVVNNLKVGEISSPVVMTTTDNKEAYRIVKLVKFTDPHKANLKDDYAKLQMAATIEKENKATAAWIDRKVTKTYLRIDDEYKTCPFDHNYFKIQ